MTLLSTRTKFNCLFAQQKSQGVKTQMKNLFALSIMAVSLMVPTVKVSANPLLDQSFCTDLLGPQTYTDFRDYTQNDSGSWNTTDHQQQESIDKKSKKIGGRARFFRFIQGGFNTETTSEKQRSFDHLQTFGTIWNRDTHEITDQTQVITEAVGKDCTALLQTHGQIETSKIHTQGQVDIADIQFGAQVDIAGIQSNTLITTNRDEWKARQTISQDQSRTAIEIARIEGDYSLQINREQQQTMQEAIKAKERSAKRQLEASSNLNMVNMFLQGW